MINKFYQEAVIPTNKAEDRNHPHHISMSDIAARLRQVQTQMQMLTRPSPQKTVAIKAQNNPNLLLKQSTSFDPLCDINERLDIISHAIISEHNGRKNSHQILLNRLDAIEAASKNNSKQSQNNYAGNTALENKIKTLIEEVLQSQLKNILSEVQKNKIEVSRQIREATAAIRFSPQLAMLERQMTDIQAKLNDDSRHFKNKSDSLNIQKIQENQLEKNKDIDLIDNSPVDPLVKVYQNLAKHNNHKPLANISTTNQLLATQDKSDFKTQEWIDLARKSQLQKNKADQFDNKTNNSRKIINNMSIILMVTVSIGLYIQFKAELSNLTMPWLGQL